MATQPIISSKNEAELTGDLLCAMHRGESEETVHNMLMDAYLDGEITFDEMDRLFFDLFVWE